MATLHIFLTIFCAFVFYLLAEKSMLSTFFKGFLKNQQSEAKLESKLKPPNPTLPQPPSSSILYSYEKAAICSDDILCSQIGRQTLQTGGSAVDAAISALFCNGLLAMQSMGLGGGMLMNVYSSSEKRAYSIQSREVAPRNFKLHLYANFTDATKLAQSGLSIAVPTELMGYAVAHKRFGKLTWFELVQPTLGICYAGYTLSKHQRDALDTNWEMISKDPLLLKMFMDPKTNKLKRVGMHAKPPSELCRTYEVIAKLGPHSFYNGDLAENLAKDLNDVGSLINIEDLNKLSIKIEESVMLPLGPYDLHFMAPPSSGYIIGFVMQILTNLFKSSESRKDLDTLGVHRIVEALKFAFVKRWQLDMEADREFLERLKCPVYAASIAQIINDTNTFEDLSHYGVNSNLQIQAEQGTAQISVLAPNGDAVSVTSSINFYFGSGRTGARTGVLFNNAMSDFNIHHLPNYFDLPNIKQINEPKPSQSPMSSMAPLIITDVDGNVRLVIGAAGGSKIISALAHILIRVLWLGENIKQAIDSPRFHHQLLPNILEYEYGIQQQIIDELEAKGHKTSRYRVRGSAVCGIERAENGAIYSNADYRKDGGVDGF